MKSKRANRLSVQPRKPIVGRNPTMGTWTVLISVKNVDGGFLPHKIREGFDSEASATAIASRPVVCPTCDGSGQIILSEFPIASGEHTPAVCIECNGRRLITAG